MNDRIVLAANRSPETARLHFDP